MSDPRQTKIEAELEQGRSLLSGIGLSPANVRRGSDPPDLIVEFADRAPLDIEVTEYHLGRDRVGMEKRWGRLQWMIYSEMLTRPHLKGVWVNLHFQDGLVPEIRHHERITKDLIRCIEYVTSLGWLNGTPRCLLFNADKSEPKLSNRQWGFLPTSKWPFLSEHLKHFDIAKDQSPYHHIISAFQPQGAVCSPSARAFLQIIEKKEESIKNAIETKKCKTALSALWLLIITNLPTDMESCIFADPYLPYVADECRESIASSHFDEVWLLEYGRHRVQSLYPYKPIQAFPSDEKTGDLDASLPLE